MLFLLLILLLLSLPTMSRKIGIKTQPSRSNENSLDWLLKVRSGGKIPTSDDEELGDSFDNSTIVEVSGAPSYVKSLDGIYFKTEWDINGRSHFERELSEDCDNPKIHLYWTGTQWVLHHDLDPSQNFENLLAYSKAKTYDPKHTTAQWFVKFGQTFEPSPTIDITEPGTRELNETLPARTDDLVVREFLGVPAILAPYYMAFMLDAVAVGLAMPLLPFYVMEFGANALQLSLVVSSNYVAQMVGCIVMGKVSDMYGRRIVLFSCLLASTISYFCIAQSQSLVAVAVARIIAGSFGGLIPVMQSSVSDSSTLSERPKYLGRITATFGSGFVFGPMISALLPFLSTRQKIRLAALFPFLGFIIALVFAKECKKDIKGSLFSRKIKQHKHVKLSSPKVVAKEQSPLNFEVLLLVLNGFLIMYAFATETIYAMFIKDSFGFGERVLSTVFAGNGVLIGFFQVFLIKPMINLLGKHATLATGNALLAIGMVGVALVRQKVLHFMLFAVHIVGYSIADTALVSLISKYSSPSSQGRDLALNQAAQSCARVLSPLFAGLLYEKSKNDVILPMGALPFLAGGLFPFAALIIPVFLFSRSSGARRRSRAEAQTSQSLKGDEEDNGFSSKGPEDEQLVS